MKRDFTYIDDIVDGVLGCCYKPAVSNKNFDFQNLFHHHHLRLIEYLILAIQNLRTRYFIKLIEKYFEIDAIKELYPMQKGEVQNTYANISELKKCTGYNPKTAIEIECKIFVIGI